MTGACAVRSAAAPPVGAARRALSQRFATSGSRAGGRAGRPKSACCSTLSGARDAQVNSSSSSSSTAIAKPLHSLHYPLRRQSDGRADIPRYACARGPIGLCGVQDVQAGGQTCVCAHLDAERRMWRASIAIDSSGLESRYLRITWPPPGCGAMAGLSAGVST